MPSLACLKAMDCGFWSMMPKLCIVMGMSGNQSSQGTITDTERVHWIILSLTRSRRPFWKLIYETLFGITNDQVNCKFRIYKFVVGGGLAQHDDVIKWEQYSAPLALCAGNSLVTGEFPTQRSVTQSFGLCFDLCPNKRLSKQSWGWWFKTPSCPLWRQSNGQVLHVGHLHIHVRVPCVCEAGLIANMVI